MNKQVFNYIVTPSVVPADEVSTVYIRPLGENTAFMAGETYTVVIREVDTAHGDYSVFTGVMYECTPDETGALVITHRFSGEQKHVLTITRPEVDLRSPHYDITHRVKYRENVTAVLGVYSLRDDLYGLRAFKGEVHCHTYESDGTQDVCHTVGNYRSAGYDFMAITDHYISMSSEKSMRLFADAPVDMTLMLGEEVHMPTEHIHAVHLGGRESVNAYFRSHKDEVRLEVDEIKKTLTLPDGVSVEDYAWRVWIANKSREFGGLSILAHPHWIWNGVFFMGEATTMQLLRDGVHDALDLCDDLNDMHQLDTSVALWNEMRLQGARIPVVASTDSHYTDASDPHRPAVGGYTLVFAKDRSPKNLMQAVRDERSLAVFNHCNPEAIHGPYRLVKFARFLLDHFYPVYMRWCHGQGVFMAEWPLCEQDTQALAALGCRSEAFAKEFYGY